MIGMRSGKLQVFANACALNVLAAEESPVGNDADTGDAWAEALVVAVSEGVDTVSAGGSGVDGNHAGG